MYRVIGISISVLMLILYFALVSVISPTVSALSPEQRRVLFSGNHYFNVEDSSTSGCLGQPGGLSSGWDPLTLEYPGIPNESQLIEATKNYILENFPRSPFASNLQYVDQIFILSKQHNVNPLLVMAVARQENGFGQSASSATAQNNYFGITQGDGYRTFSSVEEGIDYFVEKVGRHVANPEGAYEGLTNFYEYLSIHQVGMIAYPGEYPEAASGRNATPPYLTYDVRMNVYTSWDPTRNSHRSGSPVYNPGIYYSNSIDMINILTGMALLNSPIRGAAGPGGCSLGAPGIVNADGYSFPLAPQTNIVYGGLPCSNTSGCHHDGTAAFDLSYDGVEGKAVYAISDGIIDGIGTQDPGWCQSIHFQSKDGFFYWYGHVIDLLVAEGDVVKAGQQIARVATWAPDHTCNGTSSGSHLHIDRGCSLEVDGVITPQRGGYDGCRDPNFIPLMNSIYESLPA